MFERFTERALQVVVLAREEAQTLKHNYIGTEDILLGLLGEEEGVAARVLGSLDITVERVRVQVVRIVGSGEEVTSGQIQFTPRAYRVLKLALREALSLGHTYIGTEHILLSLVQVSEGVGARILLDFDADAEKVRNEVLRLLPIPEAHESRQGCSRSERITTTGGVQIMVTWLGELGPVLDQLGAEIRGELGRDPDIGDLLLVLACAHDALPARALDELGVDLDALCDTLEHVRAQSLPAQAQAREHLAEMITAARARMEQAIVEQEFERAADLRDRWRQLTKQQAHARQSFASEVLREIRPRLGIPDTDAPPSPEPS